MDCYNGTSGWHYADWRDRVNPGGLAATGWLRYYAGHFNTVEVNNSFYRLPSEKALEGWREASPPGFVFAVKASRFITHVKRLKDASEAVDNFTRRVRILGDKSGPLLYQLPPDLRRDEIRLESFLQDLPPGFRHVFEFRNASWFAESVFRILHNHNADFCIFDMPELTTPLATTADFAYLRFHGSRGLYSSSYSDEELADWAGKIAGLARAVQAVYVYFNNDNAAFAVANARTLRRYLQSGTASLC